jgi:hypothetical protein
MPFTLCLDVTLRVAAIQGAARTALRLQSEITELARDPHRWPFRYVRADVDEDDRSVLVVRALLLEPLAELYGAVGGAAAPAGSGEPDATDVLLALLDAHCPTWHGLDVDERRISTRTHRVRRRYWTGERAGPA